MKKMIVIILILFVIFIGMVIYKNTAHKSYITVKEVEQIEDYIKKIYMWQEVTDDALPIFENINEANEKWIWEVVKKNLGEYEVTYEQIQNKAKELFGQEFTKTFPKEGNESFIYNEEQECYEATEIQLDEKKDMFLIDTIQKQDEQYQVEIIEYILDYSKGQDIEDENTPFEIYIKNLKNETIATISSTENETNINQIIKDNKSKFTKKHVLMGTFLIRTKMS